MGSGISFDLPAISQGQRLIVVYDNQFDAGGQSTSDKNNTTRAILRLLDVFPELGDLGYDVAKTFPGVIERMDLNRCSGMLLRGAEIPLSVWAVVVAKINTDHMLKYGQKSRKPNVIYHMLHGPVFEGRGRFDRWQL